MVLLLLVIVLSEIGYYIVIFINSSWGVDLFDSSELPPDILVWSLYT